MVLGGGGSVGDPLDQQAMGEKRAEKQRRRHTRHHPHADKPGQLAEIFDACALVLANVEDLSIEHTPGQESGLVTLALSKSDSSKVYEQLLKDGWKVHQPRESIG